MTAIIGWAHSKFGKLEAETLESLIAGIAKEAIADAGIAPLDIDAIYVGPNDLATILYTSGTTGEPKGVMLSQSNLTSNALASAAAFVQHDDDVRVTWLPFSHIFARTCDPCQPEPRSQRWLPPTGCAGPARTTARNRPDGPGGRDRPVARRRPV